MSTEVVLAQSPDDIGNLPVEQRGQMITQALIESKQWLATATKGTTDPTEIKNFKAWAATVAEMTRQKELSQEIQLDAQEMVRRAERGITLVVREGQEAGTFRRPGESNGNQYQVGVVHEENSSKPIIADVYATTRERVDSYAMTDGVSDEDFEEVLQEARSEGSLARRRVAEKAKERSARTPPAWTKRSEKAERIREMAQRGYTSRQMEEPLKTAGTTIRSIAREHEIDIPGDRATYGTHRINPERVVQETVNTLQGVEYGLNLLTDLDYSSFSSEQVRIWMKELNEPYRAIRRLVKELNTRAR